MINTSRDREQSKIKKTLSEKLFHNLCQVNLQRFAWHPPFYGGFLQKFLNSANLTDPSNPLSAAALKWIALITMLIDHIGASTLLFYIRRHGNTHTIHAVYDVLRDIGRISFPLYIFLLVEGLQHTKNRTKYLLRLGIFALISEIPFDLAFYNIPFQRHSQNVFFTLCIGLAVIWAMDSADREISRLTSGKNAILTPWIGRLYLFFLYGALIALGCLLASILYTDYQYVGVLAICAFYLLRRYPLIAAAVSSVVLLLSSAREFFALGCLIPISLYNGKRGSQPKYFFYAFYPVHLLLLWCVLRLI